MKRLQQRRIAITGAGSGLGRALALRYARADWRVAVTDIDGQRAEAVAAEVRDLGVDCFAAVLDIRSEADLAALCAQLGTRWGGVDIFVNNAGVAGAGTVAASELEDWRWMLDINLLGAVRGTRAALPLLRASHGQLVNIASFAAIAAAPGMAAYNVSKAGVLSLSESVRGEELDYGVGVTVACPAFFATNLLQSFRGSSQQKDTVEKLMQRADVGADDVAGDIFDAVAANRFLVISQPTSKRQYWLKRLLPETFFRRVHAAARGFVTPESKPPSKH